MKKKLTYGDIIDLEYYLHADHDMEREALHTRDRSWRLELEGEPMESLLIRHWLDHRRSQGRVEGEITSPGILFQKLLDISLRISPVKGVIAGILCGFGFFTYNGSTPINVFHFLLFFVLSQLLVTCLFGLGGLMRILAPAITARGFDHLGRLLAATNRFVLRKILFSRLDSHKRLSIEHATGLIRAHSTVYGRLFAYPFLKMIQSFGVGLNVGLLGITLIRVATSDLAFGWQSTLNISAQFLARLVNGIALPWSWFTGDAAVPSLLQIEGSRIILKDSIAHLMTTDLTSWWPFLVMSLLVYGLLVRILLLAWVWWKETRVLSAFKFSTGLPTQLLRRMRTPTVSTQAVPEPTEEKIPPPSGPPVSGQDGIEEDVIALIPQEISATCNSSWLESKLAPHQLQLADHYIFMTSYEEDQKLLKKFTDRNWQLDEQLLIVMEGWMVPLMDFLSLLRELRKILPPGKIIHITLLGKPESTGFAPVMAEDLSLWRSKIESLGDPFIHLFPLEQSV